MLEEGVVARVAPRERAGLRVAALDRAQAKARWRATLDGATTAALRLTDGHLTVCDDRGRLLAVELEHGGLTRDLRV